MIDTKLILAAVITILFIFHVTYELLKEKLKAKRDKLERDDYRTFYKIINEQLVENSNVNKEMLKYLRFSTQKYLEEITESQVRIVIDSVLNNSQFDVYNYISKVIKENHIKGNEKEVASKIKLFISNRFHKDFLMLKEFKFKEKSLGDYNLSEWREYLNEAIISNVLKEKGEKSLYSTLQNSYDSFKYDIIDKLLS